MHVGPAGSGQTVKAANQLIVAGNIELLAEAIVFLEAYGVDTEAALQVLGGGLAGSTVLDRKGANMLAREFKPGLPARPAPQGHGHRDLGRPRGRASSSRSAPSSPSSSPRLVARGDGGLDHSGLLKLVAELSGRSDSTLDHWREPIWLG